MDHAAIYDGHAESYDRLVAAEDCDGALLPALAAVAPLAGAAVLDVGCGTGRITRLVARHARRVVGVDRAPAMLAVARRHLEALGTGAAAWELHCADAGALPVPGAWADLAVAGWAFGHFRRWMPEAWRATVGRGLDEMTRALRPGGALVVLETLGTGVTEPAAPDAGLAEYYAWLEAERGFARTVLRTDYRFPDVATAAAVTGFFFGEDFARRVVREGWARVPECTGLWSRRV